MKRAIDLGPVDAAAIKTSGGKIRLRLLLTADQLEAMLIAARADETDLPDMKRNETQCNAPDETQTRSEGDDEDDAQARESAPRVVPPTAPVGRVPQVFVRIGTPAWEAWVSRGHDPGLAVRREIEGRVRTGWDFPTLFPPKADNTTEPTGAR